MEDLCSTWPVSLSSTCPVLHACNPTRLLALCSERPGYLFDFSIQQKFAVLLSQTPTVLKSAATMLPAGRDDQKLKSCAKQECDYIRKKVSSFSLRRSMHVCTVIGSLFIQPGAFECFFSPLALTVQAAANVYTSCRKLLVIHVSHRLTYAIT